MWKVSGTSRSLDLLGDFTPLEVLFEFDGPRTFICHGPGQQLLFAHQCGEDDGFIRYAVVPVDADELAQVKSGNIDLPTILHRSPLWLVDLDRRGQVCAVRESVYAAIPGKYLPMPGATLWPNTVALPKVTIDQ